MAPYRKGQELEHIWNLCVCLVWLLNPYLTNLVMIRWIQLSQDTQIQEKFQNLHLLWQDQILHMEVFQEPLVTSPGVDLYQDSCLAAFKHIHKDLHNHQSWNHQLYMSLISHPHQLIYHLEVTLLQLHHLLCTSAYSRAGTTLPIPVIQEDHSLTMLPCVWAVLVQLFPLLPQMYHNLINNS